jgi:hypothetical protein
MIKKIKCHIVDLMVNFIEGPVDLSLRYPLWDPNSKKEKKNYMIIE